MPKLIVTLEKTYTAAKEFDVTDEQLEELKRGVNPFHEDLEPLLAENDAVYDYYVADETGKTIVDWG